MKAPIVRQVTGARRIPRRRRPRGARAPLRRPLALLYRHSARARAAAPAAVRGADGHSVPLAPRLQIALHLSLTLYEQHRTFQLFAAPSNPAPVMPAATAAPTQRQAAPSRRFSSAAHSRRADTVYRMPAEARVGSPLSFAHSAARGNADQVSRHESFIHARPGFRTIALPSRGRRGQDSNAPAAYAGVAPRWPLSDGTGTARSADSGSGPAGRRRLFDTRLGGRPAVSSAGAAARHASSNPVAARNLFVAERQGGEARVGAAAAKASGRPDRGLAIEGRSAVPPPARGNPVAGRSLFVAERLGGGARVGAAAAKASGKADRGMVIEGRSAVPPPARGDPVAGRKLFVAARPGGGARVGAAAAKAPDRPDRGLVIEGRSAVPPPARGDPVADRKLFVAARQGGGARVGAAAAKAHGRPARETVVKGRGAAPPRALSGSSGAVATLRSGVRPSPADRHLGRPASARAAPSAGTNGTALRTSAAGPAGRPPQRAGQPPSRLISPRPPSGTALTQLARQRRGTLPSAAGIASTSGSQAARGGAAPLYLGQRSFGRNAAPGSFSPAWAAPPLDYRSPAPPPAPQPQPETRPAATTAPSAPPIDLEAVSRDVIGRIEKRLRVERERRGRP